MRSRFVTALFSFVLLACGPSIRVNTVSNPAIPVAELHTFLVLPVPERRQPARNSSNLDPMLANSITNRTLREALVRAFEQRGYVPSEDHPDFTVAYYAAAREKLDVTYYDYGYRWHPGWWRGWGDPVLDRELTEYTEGTVIVDVVNPQSHDLLWRGRGVAAVSDEPKQYQRDLRDAVDAIVRRFPSRGGQRVAVR